MKEAPLTLGEKVSWFVQGIIRRWVFLLTILFITLVCWATNNQTVLTWWNLSASLMALVIESIVGLAMFGQTKRDALVLRHTAATTDTLTTTLALLQHMLTRIEALEEQKENTPHG